MAQYNFRLFVKPTVIGQAIIDRLSPDGADRQALARRWIELGYALEQAGFRLDGTTVFHGGTQVSIVTPVALPVPAQWPESPAAGGAQSASALFAPSASAPPGRALLAVPAAPSSGAPVSATDSALETPAPVSPSSGPAPVQLPRSSPGSDEMTDNLRNLSM